MNNNNKLPEIITTGFWGHFSQLTCHPGLAQTLHFPQKQLWCHSIPQDAESFISTSPMSIQEKLSNQPPVGPPYPRMLSPSSLISPCPICVWVKISNQPPAGLLNSLPIQRHPWSHIVLDFKTGLPLSDRNTSIITVFDQFSKALHFIYFPKLPFAAVIAVIPFGQACFLPPQFPYFFFPTKDPISFLGYGRHSPVHLGHQWASLQDLTQSPTVRSVPWPLGINSRNSSSLIKNHIHNHFHQISLTSSGTASKSVHSTCS